MKWWFRFMSELLTAANLDIVIKKNREIKTNHFEKNFESKKLPKLQTEEFKNIMYLNTFLCFIFYL